MSAGRTPIPAAVSDGGVIAILRADGNAHLEAVATTLALAGVHCLELTMTTPGATDALRRLRAVLDPGVALGMGTVTSAAQAQAALAAGAEFLVSPAACPEVVAFAVAARVGVYPGALTPTEVLAAWQAGATAVKLFPASVGGAGLVATLRGPLPEIPLIPTGGVALDQVSAYVTAGAVAVGLGGPLIGDALSGGSLDALARRARAALAAVTEGRAAR